MRKGGRERENKEEKKKMNKKRITRRWKIGFLNRDKLCETRVTFSERTRKEKKKKRKTRGKRETEREGGRK